MNSPRAPRTRNIRCPECHSQNCQAHNGLVPPEILVVEDGSGMFANIGALLQKRGFQIILAPDAATALQEIDNYAIDAVIAGASLHNQSGLEVLAAAKKKPTGVKTVIITSVRHPDLPVQAYEMDLDDYVHWPLSAAALSARLRGLLGLEADSPVMSLEGPEGDWQAQSMHFLTLLVDTFTNSLSAISQSLEEVRGNHREGMSAELSADLIGLAAQVRHLGDRMRQVCHFNTDEAASAPTAPSRSVH